MARKEKTNKKTNKIQSLNQIVDNRPENTNIKLKKIHKNSQKTYHIVHKDKLFVDQ